MRLLESDVNDISRETLGVDAIDAAYSRLMLLHQPDPARVLGHVATLLKPGGVFIAHEPGDDLEHAPSSEPGAAAMRRVWDLVIRAARLRGARTDFGRRGRAYFAAAGFRVEHSRAYFVHYPPEIGYEIPRVALSSLRPVIEDRLAGSDEIAELDTELQLMKSRPDVQWVTSPLMFEWIARKNGDGRA